MVVVWVDTAVVEGMDPMAEGSIRKAMVVAWMEGIINRLTIVLCCRWTALSQISCVNWFLREYDYAELSSFCTVRRGDIYSPMIILCTKSDRINK